jgi:hypothetical protein
MKHIKYESDLEEKSADIEQQCRSVSKDGKKEDLR